MSTLRTTAASARRQPDGSVTLTFGTLDDENRLGEVSVSLTYGVALARDLLAASYPPGVEQ